MNYQKINYYYELCLKNTLAESRLVLKEHSNSLSDEDFAQVKERLIKQFPEASQGSLQPKKFQYLMEEDLPDMNWLHHDLTLRSGGCYFLTGFSNAGKSFLACYLGLCIENNLPIFGEMPQQHGAALHLDWELGIDTHLYYYKMINALKIDNNLETIRTVDYLDMREHFNLNDQDQQMVKDKLVELCKGYRLVYIDSFIASIPGIDINDDRVRQYTDLLNIVAEKSGTCIVLLHHEAKAGASDPLKKAKGSSSLIASVRGSLHVERQKNKEIKLETGKQRLCKDKELYYNLVDVGEYSEKLKNQCGLALQLVQDSANKTIPELELKINILKKIKELPGFTTGAIVEQFAISYKRVTEFIKQFTDEQSITTTIVKVKGNPHQHFITSTGDEWLLTQENYK
jgi:AAA domain